MPQTQHNQSAECVTDEVPEPEAISLEWMTVVVAVEMNICASFRSDGRSDQRPVYCL